MKKAESKLTLEHLHWPPSMRKWCTYLESLIPNQKTRFPLTSTPGSDMKDEIIYSMVPLTQLEIVLTHLVQAIVEVC